MKRLLKPSILLFLIIAISGCAGMRFERVIPFAAVVPVDTLDRFFYKEAWFGLVFTGERVGFTHYKVSKIEDGLYEIFAEGHLHIRFMGVDQRISIMSWDTVDARLRLVSMRWEERLGKKFKKVVGRVENGVFNAQITVAGATTKRSYPLKEALYPEVALEFYPVFNGLIEGKEYSYLIFNAEHVVLTRATQKVGYLMKNPDLFAGAGYKVVSRVAGVKSTSWVSPKGLTLLERTVGGVLIRYPESERVAKGYLASAALSKKELVLNISRIKTDRDIPCPRETTLLSVEISGLKEKMDAITDGRQTAQVAEETTRFFVDINSSSDLAGKIDEKERIIYVLPTPSVESDNPEIKAKAEEIARGAETESELVDRLARWVDRNVINSYEDSFSALAVLKDRKGECQAHTLLYTALARALNLPTRVVSGLVYLEDRGFLYHAWAETYAEGRWRAVDPTFGQLTADATHIKLTQGPDFFASLKISELIGNIKIKVVSSEPRCQEKKEGPGS